MSAKSKVGFQVLYQIYGAPGFFDGTSCIILIMYWGSLREPHCVPCIAYWISLRESTCIRCMVYWVPRGNLDSCITCNVYLGEMIC